MASMSCAISPPAYASYDVLVHQLAGLRPASFRPPLAGWPLPFASSYRLLTTRCSTVIFLQRTFTSLVHAHAGRTQIRRLVVSLRTPTLSIVLGFASSPPTYIKRKIRLNLRALGNDYFDSRVEQAQRFHQQAIRNNLQQTGKQA